MKKKEINVGMMVITQPKGAYVGIIIEIDSYHVHIKWDDGALEWYNKEYAKSNFEII